MPERSIVHATFTLERNYPVPVDDVFRAWAEPEVKGRWFAPDCADYQLDFRPGGIEHNSTVVNGKKVRFESLYREVVTNERLA
jgi:uncharacterized protein YndB with AHSA1/START domain